MIVVLASNSPRRREILTLAGIPFTVRVPDIPEILSGGESAGAYVKRLAAAKAHAVTRSPSEIVLAADTVVVVDGLILEKPDDPEDARWMIWKLSGREHQVLTGICLLLGDEEIVDVATTLVRFSDLTSEEVDEYVNSGEPVDKAGSYAIQGLASKFIESVNGCYFNVMGLPISLVYKHLKRFQ